jgi:hypothetical protein
MSHKVPTRVWAIVLLGLAVSACSSGYNISPGATAFCQPGICVGSTPDSTPDSLAYLAR